MKILIIGQAPPLKKQGIPYDSTLLYKIFEWVGISKELAQFKFEFEALTDQFPGLNKTNGHKAPSKEQMDIHWNKFLRNKIENSEKVILLGGAAKKYFFSKPKTWSCTLHIYEMVHPSRRNYSRIMNNRSTITKSLTEFLET